MSRQILAKVTCDKCGLQDSVTIPVLHPVGPTVMVRTELTDTMEYRGWACTIEGLRCVDICPTCRASKD